MNIRSMARRTILTQPVLPLLLLAVLLALPVQTQAAVRAWLDRDQVGMGETATLNVESDETGVAAPDWSALEADFRVTDHVSSRSVEIVNGRRQARILFAVALQPLREGVLTVPALQVGGERTEPLALTVAPAATAPARAGEPSFIESEVSTSRAWVQQAIGYVVRLYYATPLVSGQLDQPPPEGAALQRIGSDVQYTRRIGGRSYRVIERRYLLVPERSGPLQVPAAHFSGRGTGGWFDDVFRGGAGRELRAHGTPVEIEVEPIPDSAAQPWLPLHGLELQYLETPQSVRADGAATVVVELRADGATASQMPELRLGNVDGAQVFPEPQQVTEHFERGRPQVRLTRSFAVVPDAQGTLRIPGPRLSWFDTRTGKARSTSLPELSLDVQPPLARASGPAGSEDDARVRIPGVQGEVRPWALATVVFALLWLATLAWGLHRRPGPAVAGAAASPLSGGDSPAARLRRLRSALDTGDLGEVSQALCALHDPVLDDPDALRLRLADPDQCAAVDALQRARWADCDSASARAMVRAAFSQGPRWLDDSPATVTDPLPPLYPD